jgi:hypothetical protein
MANFGVWCVRNKIAKISSAKLLEELPPRIWNNSKFEIYYKPLLKLEKLESESKTKNGKFYLKIWNKLKYFTSKLK